MTFLNATLIFGMAAAALPLVLHLIARREPRRVVFPSVRFLTKRYESNRSRLRVRRWWLLAMRIFALALLALALARPAIHQSLSVTWLTIGVVAALGMALLVLASVALAKQRSRTTAYGLAAAALVALLVAGIWSLTTYASGPSVSDITSEPVAMAIVLDNAPSSAWKTSQDDRIERMKELAAWMITRLPRTSRIAIVDRSAQVATFSLDAGSALSKVQQLDPRQVVQPIASRIDAAVRLVRSSDLTNRQVLVVTDLARSSWNESVSEAGLSAVLAEDPPVSLTVFDLGGFQAANRSLSLPALSDATPPQGAPVPVSTTLQLRSDGNDADAMSVTAELQMYDNDPALPVVRDGEIARPPLRTVDRTSVKVAAGGSTDLLLTIPALTIGTHHGQVRLVGPDAMPLDDVRYFSLQVLPPSRVLVVSDNEDEAEVISLAITAAPGLIEGQQAEFVVERVAFTDFDVVRLSDFDAVYLLNPPATALDSESLVDFARAGKGLFVCLGPAIGQQGTEAGELLPPLQLRWRPPAPGTFLQTTAASHPVIQTLASGTPWADFRIQQYWQLEPQPNDRVLMRYAGTQHAALVERLITPAGDASSEATADVKASAADDSAGRVLVLSTPLPALAQPAAAWNELFGMDPWPAWLLTRQSVEYLTRRSASDVVTTVGTPMPLKLSGPQDGGGEFGETTATTTADSVGGDTQRLQLFPPGDAAPRPLEVDPQAERVVVTDVSQAGTYWLRGTSIGAGFSANLAPAAIDLQQIEPGLLDQVFGPEQYRLVSDREGIEFAESQAAQRVSLHSPAILLVLVVFLLEQILSNRFYRSQ